MRYTVIQAPLGFVVRDTETLMATEHPGFGKDRKAAEQAVRALNEQHTNECPRCHALRCAGPVTERPYKGLCAACFQEDRKPQGQVVKLFEPAPNQLPGQLSF